MHFLISCSYLTKCRLLQPYSSILKCFLLLHSGRPNLVTCLSYLSRSCRVTGKGISVSHLRSPVWQLQQSHRVHAPVMAIKSFFLFTVWRWKVFPQLPIRLSFSCLYCQPFQQFIFFHPIPCLHSSSSCPHWQGELHSEVFPTSTPSSVVSEDKIPWTRSTWRNHSLSRVPQI